MCVVSNFVMIERAGKGKTISHPSLACSSQQAKFYRLLGTRWCNGPEKDRHRSNGNDNLHGVGGTQLPVGIEEATHLAVVVFHVDGGK